MVSQSGVVSGMTIPRPCALLAEITYRCPLHCPYCSNPIAVACADAVESAVPSGDTAEPNALRTAHTTAELSTDEWKRVIREAADLGILQIGFSGGEPLARRDLPDLIRAASIPLSLNFVIHRRNIDRLPQMIELAESLHAERVELANVQFYGWAFLNRAALLPTREQVVRAREIATAAKARLAGKIDIFYVLPDYYENRPKPCLSGWGQRYLTVNPIGEVLPCPTASSAIPDLRFENVRARDLDWIWRESESFNRFRGTEWMPEPCQSCPQREIDFGGCRCQAALLTGNAANTDPVCELSPNRASVDAVLHELDSLGYHAPAWTYRTNPKGSPVASPPVAAGR